MIKSIIEGISEYFMKCPLLKDGAFRVDAMGNDKIEYLIETSTFTPIKSNFIDDDCEKVYLFNFGSREYYSLDRLNNIENSQFYEKFSEWVEEQEYKENYPEMPESCYPIKIEALSSGYLFQADAKMARYQIQLKLTYIERRKH